MENLKWKVETIISCHSHDFYLLTYEDNIYVMYNLTHQNRYYIKQLDSDLELLIPNGKYIFHSDDYFIAWDHHSCNLYYLKDISQGLVQPNPVNIDYFYPKYFVSTCQYQGQIYILSSHQQFLYVTTINGDIILTRKGILRSGFIYQHDDKLLILYAIDNIIYCHDVIDNCIINQISIPHTETLTFQCHETSQNIIIRPRWDYYILLDLHGKFISEYNNRKGRFQHSKIVNMAISGKNINCVVTYYGRGILCLTDCLTGEQRKIGYHTNFSTHTNSCAMIQHKEVIYVVTGNREGMQLFKGTHKPLKKSATKR